MNENTMTIFEQDESGRMLQALRSPETIAYCSFVANTPDEKIKLYNAMTNPEKKVSEMVNKKIPGSKASISMGCEKDDCCLKFQREKSVSKMLNKYCLYYKPYSISD